MSILLDSLRKSEAQRKIKDAPTIHSAEAYGSARRGPPHWLAPGMVVLTAAAVTWFGWQQFAVPDGEGGNLPAVAIEGHPPGDPEPARAAQSAAPEQPAADAGDARTPVERLSNANDAPDAEAPEAASPADSIADFVAQQEAQVEALVEGNGDPMDADGAGGDEELPYPAESAGDVAADFSELEPPVDEPRRRGQRQAGADEPRSYWQLPQSYRSEMPEFKISVLVYAEAAQDRFLLMNGERLREGDEVDGVVLEEIRRDGAVFSYRQTRFLVKS